MGAMCESNSEPPSGGAVNPAQKKGRWENRPFPSRVPPMLMHGVTAACFNAFGEKRLRENA